MKCEKLDSRIISHFITRFMQRVGDMSKLDYLYRNMMDNVQNGLIERDNKHEGIEGDRYKTYIELDDYQYIVIFEKTPRCILPITVFPFKKVR